MSLQYKAYLVKGKGTVKEIRRFTVDEAVTSSHEYLKTKVASVFPSIGNLFTLHYKDVEGDFISFSSDEELMQALTQITDSLFRLYVRIKKDDGKDDEDCSKRWKKFPSMSGQYPHEVPSYHSHHRHQHVPPPPPHQQWFHGFGNYTPHAWGFGPWGHPAPQNQQQQRQYQQQTPGENAQSSAYASADGKHQQQSQSQGPAQTAQSYLNSVGEAVAGFLKPLGIDVDVDVEHHGERTKCAESEIKKKQREEAEKEKEKEETPPKTTDITESVSPAHEPTAPPCDGNWTVVTDEDDAEVTETMNVDIPSDTDPRLASALKRLYAMGFSDDGGWLSRLLEANDYDIARALDAMQPAGHGAMRA